MEKKIPVIIDCDTGVDDAGALMMACASDRLDILAVTTVSGNVGLEHTHPNTLNVLKLFGRAALPVSVTVFSYNKAEISRLAVDLLIDRIHRRHLLAVTYEPGCEMADNGSCAPAREVT